MTPRKILIWLPSPLGDAVMATPALKAIRQKYKDDEIHFLANSPVKAVLSGTPFNDRWIDITNNSLTLAANLRKARFTHALLFKNSFGSALTVFLAGIKHRVGYARDNRSFLLTEKIPPLKNPDGTYKPSPMIDYYAKIAETMDCQVQNKTPELFVNQNDENSLPPELKKILYGKNPVIILVPGGAFGPSKCWPADRYSRTADLLNKKYNAEVLVSVAPTRPELQIADTICSAAPRAVNLGKLNLSLAQLKALYAKSSLVITNDTGPRHIAIALNRKVITLFGPNDPQWTQTGHKDEIRIVGNAPCLPCAKPECFQTRHICMESITVEKVIESVEKLIGEDLHE